jgi:hypothetical protein
VTVGWPRSPALDYLHANGHGSAREVADGTGMSIASVASRRAKACAAGRAMRRAEPGGFRYWPAGGAEPAVGARHAPPVGLRPETVVLLAVAREPGSTAGEIAEATLLDMPDVESALALLERCDAVERQGSCYRICP